MRVLKLFSIIKASIADTINHDGVEHAGYLAFLLMLTIFPFLVFFVAVVGLIGNQALANTFVELINESSWNNMISALRPRIIEITSTPPQRILTLAVLSAVWTASSIFEASRTILNKAYRVKTPPAYIWRRLLSIIEFLIMITITIAIVIFLIIIPYAVNQIYTLLHMKNMETWKFLTPSSLGIRYAILIVFGFLILSLLYYILPNKKQKLLHTFPGAAVVLFAWSMFTMLFKYYITTFHQLNLVYGSIAGIIVSLIYFYVCSLIFIFGAEFNHHLEKK